MEKLDSFTIRIYAIIIHENRLMLLKEPYAGEILYKLPGGGLEFGESTTECLSRELMEELNLTAKSVTHFYTQEQFLRSKFRPNEQLFTAYYRVEIEDFSQLEIIDKNIEEILWVSLLELEENHVSLPVDKKVVSLLLDSPFSS